MIDVPVVQVSKQQNLEIGKSYDLQYDYTVYKKTVKVVDKKTGKTLAVFIKNIITDPVLIKAGRNLTTFKGTTERRADASGERILFEPKSGTSDKVHHHGKAVPSVMLGYNASDNFHPCRMTALTRKHRDLFDNDTVVLVQYISKLFKEYCPNEYNKQKAFVDQCNSDMILPKTVFTSLTVNMTWRTSLHIDKGDFASGLGNLCCFKYGNYSQAELMLPNYKIAFDLLEGDVLFMDVHEPHCNNSIVGEGRVSLICYAREQILNRCKDVSKSEIENPVAFISREKRAKGPCVNCSTTVTAEWRYTNNGLPLCNPCGMRYKKTGKLVPRDTPTIPQQRKPQAKVKN